MRNVLPLTLCGLIALSACAPNPQTGTQPATLPQEQTRAQALSPAAALVEQAAKTLDVLRKTTPDRILDEAILSARAVIVLPGIYQAGFIYSVHGGNGVLIARRPDGGWGAPVFVSVAGAGYGLQAGLERSRLVLTVMEDEMLARILDCGLSFDATAQYDILGVRETTGPNSLTQERPVMAFADGMGMMAGIALRGGVLTVNRDTTRTYHGAAAGTLEETMRGTSAPGLETFTLWASLGVTPEAATTNAVIRVAKP